MSIIDLARDDVQTILTDPYGFAESITLIPPAGKGDTIETYALGTKHHNAMDTEGNQANTQISSVTLSEKDLIEKGYQYTNANDEVDLNGHKVIYPDVTEGFKKFIINEFYPDRKLGCIICFLSNFID